jgi:hypothetical protein
LNLALSPRKKQVMPPEPRRLVDVPAVAVRQQETSGLHPKLTADDLQETPLTRPGNAPAKVISMGADEAETQTGILSKLKGWLRFGRGA